MAAPPEIVELVERFERYVDTYKSSQYNETQVRREFVDPFFKALGWDIDNAQGYAEAYKDVIHEDAIKIGDSTKAPDYSFRIGGTRKFFVETKKPSVNLKDDISPAFQLRRYAWSAKLPLSVLTDFEELAVYDCRVPPVKTDKASKARTMYFTYKEYLERWDEIAGIFSREAILKGSFDKYAETNKTKRGTAEVDAAFLEEIASWREILARNIALRNIKLGTSELNTAVQSTIDRIIFLRICEDRGIEKYGQLQALLEGDGTYQKLCELFMKADDRYNSGLFHFQVEPDRTYPDTSTLKLNIDDKTIKDIIRRLYYPDSPYEFSVLPAEILGHVYEQFLGKVIRLTEGHRAVVEDKPEVKKAGGVYYTPSFIVDYIVHQTVVKQTEGKTPKEVSELRVLDPACGSGSFLIGAYQHLLDWHRDWYAQNLMPLLENGEPETSPKIKKLLPSEYIAEPPTTGNRRKKKRSFQSLPIYQAGKGYWPLTADEKKRILLNNIYGVDLDPQAVEVTKLSLLLKVLEGENTQTIQTLFKFTGERVLPDLVNNIKCGNTLVEWDILNDYPNLPDEVRPFDWNVEFPDIMQAGGFDAVIGNPPYVRQESLGRIKEYFEKHYSVYHGIADLYVYFIERGISLLKDNGIFSYIVANKWMRANYGKPLRRWLKNQHIEEIADFGDLPVFQRATTYPCIIRVSKRPFSPNFRVVQVKTLNFTDLGKYVDDNSCMMDQRALEDKGWSLVDDSAHALIGKLNAQCIPLGKYVGGKIYNGVKTGFNKAYIIDAKTKEKLITEDPRSAEIIKPFLVGRDVKRYQPTAIGRYLIYIPWHFPLHSDPNILSASAIAESRFKEEYPAVYNHLLKFKPELSARDKAETGIKYEWYVLQRPKFEIYSEFEKPKIILPDIAERGNFAFDAEGTYYCANACYIIPVSDKYILGILNSSLIAYFYRSISSVFRGGYLRFTHQYMAQIPVYPINLSNTTDRFRYDRIVSMVESMLDLNKRLADAQTGHEKTMLQRQIDATDKQIDKLVYELYGLTEEEIKIVEGA